MRGLLLVVFFLAIGSMTITTIFAQENSEECKKRVTGDGTMTVAEKRIALKDCVDADNDQKYAIDKGRGSAVGKSIIQFCDDYYEMYVLFGEHNFLATTKHPFARPCVLLFESPIWKYEGWDRVTVMVKFLNTEIEEHLEQTKEERKELVKESILTQGKSMINYEKFQEIEQKIRSLENQLIEKDIEIAAKDTIIAEQLKVIMDLANKIKKIVTNQLIPILAPM